MKHEKQKQWYGCIWHAIYAVTGNKELLQYAHIMHPLAVQHTLQKHGLTMNPISINQNGFLPLPDQHTQWEHMQNHAKYCHPHPAKFILTIKSTTGYHDIGCLITPEGEVEISDSLKDGKEYHPTITAASEAYQLHAITEICNEQQIEDAAKMDAREIKLSVYKELGNTASLNEIYEQSQQATKN